MKNYIIGTNNRFYYYFEDSGNFIYKKSLFVMFCKFPQKAAIFDTKEEAEDKIKYIVNINYKTVFRYSNAHTGKLTDNIKPSDFITGEGLRPFRKDDFTIYTIEYLVEEAS